MIIHFYGKIIAKKDEPGMGFFFSPGDRQTVSQVMRTSTTTGASIPDGTGAPLNVSAVINYFIKEPVPYLFNIESPENYMDNQAKDVLRRVCGKFPFRANEPGMPSLSEDTSNISNHMTAMLNRRVSVAGFEITRMSIMEIAYTPEMA